MANTPENSAEPTNSQHTMALVLAVRNTASLVRFQLSVRAVSASRKAPAAPMSRGYTKLYFDHVQQAHQGAVDHVSRLETVRRAAIEVRNPTVYGQLIIMIVYIPILTLEGVEGKMFRPMAWTVMFVLVGSLIFNLPFALIGGVFALFLSGQYLSVPASVGFVVLFGVALVLLLLRQFLWRRWLIAGAAGAVWLLV